MNKLLIVGGAGLAAYLLLRHRGPSAPAQTPGLQPGTSTMPPFSQMSPELQQLLLSGGLGLHMVPGQAPVGTPAPTGPAGDAGRILDLTNAIRARGQQCNDASGYNPPRPPLRWSPVLAQIAQAHADWMAQHREMTHYGDGDPVSRAQRFGYRNLGVGENVASATPSKPEPEEAIRAWVESHQGHCENLMRSGITEMGAAFATGSDGRRYWAQEFGTPA